MFQNKHDNRAEVNQSIKTRSAFFYHSRMHALSIYYDTCALLTFFYFSWKIVFTYMYQLNGQPLQRFSSVRFYSTGGPFFYDIFASLVDSCKVISFVESAN